ncbi:Undecaprenyl phosphate N,N'-diacetylbacillosamine 1-phosphate transferase [Falsiruegeria litorea R37]|uniref:Undecaprenyl phosphate N,N'-diacetylbacillosamine 1-phosphate transferase n=1 Tax=Falsiruegeria litorea R37 TaxID=1200284 RepID=A0A1Y5RY79_9RHOB|nr:sugar transferase [Falsiruegeria litorea]SLN26884.1 Undecaprenyl phosphate N,N'-diacetylbacillosamine 1-phosphate transferase [Falsiruegeria litorea R37]
MKEDSRQLRLNECARLTDGLSSNERQFYRSVGKRVFDIALAVILLVVCFPVILLIAFMVWLEGGPPVFSHERIGRGGREFNCLKFRTMRVDSERLLRRHLQQNADARLEWDNHQKLTDDPRVTRLGLFLRRTSLDELPQLVNVLRGDMSIVGPRPVTVDELERYSANLPKYLALRPGVTGVWQVHGRGRVSYEERVRMDARYFTSLTFGGDVSLILKTSLVVLRRQGQ